jgi:hypothetical protein
MFNFLAFMDFNFYKNLAKDHHGNQAKVLLYQKSLKDITNRVGFHKRPFFHN